MLMPYKNKQFYPVTFANGNISKHFLYSKAMLFNTYYTQKT